MRMKRMICLVMVCCVFIGTVAMPVRAVEAIPQTEESNIVSPLATNSFNLSVPANTKVRADTSFPLAAGETVTIKASFSPFSASLDVGLIAPDGNFYYFSVTGGIIDETILVNESGNYTFQIRNNADTEVKVSGFVNY